MYTDTSPRGSFPVKKSRLPGYTRQGSCSPSTLPAQIRSSYVASTVNHSVHGNCSDPQKGVQRSICPKLDRGDRTEKLDLKPHTYLGSLCIQASACKQGSTAHKRLEQNPPLTHEHHMTPSNPTAAVVVIIKQSESPLGRKYM